MLGKSDLDRSFIRQMASVMTGLFFYQRTHAGNTNSVTATNKTTFPFSPLINSHDNTLLCSYGINQHLQVTNPCERTNDHSKQ